MAKIDFSKMTEWQKHFITHLMTQFVHPDPGGKKFVETFGLAKYTTPEGDLAFDIEVRVNGVEVPYAAMVEWHEKNLDYMVCKAARKLIKERVGELQEKLFRLETAIKRHVNDIFPELGDDD